MLYKLAPAGDLIKYHSYSEWNKYFNNLFRSMFYRFYDSGTSALAAGILAAKRQKEAKQPEVILPAYGCPDLVSAVLYARCKPILVDLMPDKPWIDIDKLVNLLNENTVAIVSVDLFGISEQYEKLKNITKERDIFLIQDSAQKFDINDSERSIYGDITTLSFGRGKPVSILGGGVLITQNKKLFEYSQFMDEDSKSILQESISHWIKISLYNFMIQPRIYWVTKYFPFLHLGETRFYFLEKVSGLSEIGKALLPSNISRYLNRDAIIEKKIKEVIRGLGCDEIIDLPEECNMNNDERLNRYPLLIKDSVLRERIYSALDKSGLGVSKMYPTTINKIAGLQNYLNSEDSFISAETFSNQILTLPTHSLVSDIDIKKINNIFVNSIFNK